MCMSGHEYGNAREKGRSMKYLEKNMSGATTFKTDRTCNVPKQILLYHISPLCAYRLYDTNT
jgi:hypothetical protein